MCDTNALCYLFALPRPVAALPPASLLCSAVPCLPAFHFCLPLPSLPLCRPLPGSLALAVSLCCCCCCCCCLAWHVALLHASFCLSAIHILYIHTHTHTLLSHTTHSALLLKLLPALCPNHTQLSDCRLCLPFCLPVPLCLYPCYLCLCPFSQCLYPCPLASPFCLCLLPLLHFATCIADHFTHLPKHTLL